MSSTQVGRRMNYLQVNEKRHCIGEKGNRETRVANSFIVADYGRKIAQGQWSFLGLGSEKKWYGTDVYKPNGK